MKLFSRASKAGDRPAATCVRNSFCARHPSPVTRHFSAFTLIEIMVAMAIFAMVVTAIYSAWMLILRATQVGQDAAAQAQRQRITLRTIEDSITCIQSFQASMKYYSFVVENGDQPLFSYTSRVPDVFPRNGKFGDYNLRRLAFSIEPGANGEKDLVLRQNPVLMDMDPDEQTHPLVLARNVQKFVIECWDTNQMDWVQEWLTTNSIPPMIRINLTLGGNTESGNSAPQLSISRVVSIPSGTMPAVVQTGTGGPGGVPGLPGINGINGINLAPPGGRH
jgi:prepilin-type N-terminal cleavage/methylation domain-containing protein